MSPSIPIITFGCARSTSRITIERLLLIECAAAENTQLSGIGASRIRYRSTSIFTVPIAAPLQIKTHIGDLMIPGQAEVGHGLANLLFGFLFHSKITVKYYTE